MIATFRMSSSASSTLREVPGNIYFAIALTTLDAETGLLNFFPNDRIGTSSGQAEVLKPGDGIVCRGEDINPEAGGEGGVILLIHYLAEGSV